MVPHGLREILLLVPLGAPYTVREALFLSLVLLREVLLLSLGFPHALKEIYLSIYLS